MVKTCYDYNMESKLKKIFISYSWRDKETVNQIDKDLQTVGITLIRDISGNDNNQSLFFWIITPSSDLSLQNYTSYEDWIINVYP